MKVIWLRVWKQFILYKMKNLKPQLLGLSPKKLSNVSLTSRMAAVSLYINFYYIPENKFFFVFVLIFLTNLIRWKKMWETCYCHTIVRSSVSTSIMAQGIPILLFFIIIIFFYLLIFFNRWMKENMVLPVTIYISKILIWFDNCRCREWSVKSFTEVVA